MEKLIVQVVVGYMLKVMKSGKPIIKHLEAFKKIRHGDFDNFIKIIDEPIPPIAINYNGVIKNSYSSQEEDSDFAGLICSGPSLIKFYEECLTEYGNIEDEYITDEVFEKMVLFELSIRMHANNSKLLSKWDVLKVAINKLSELKKLTNEEKVLLHKGRTFINCVKHNKLTFPSWSEGNIIFIEACNVLVNHQLTILFNF
jgi:hypothetical protein